MKLKITPVKDLRTKKPAELAKYVSELRVAQTELSHGLATNKEKQTHQVKLIKKAIATAQTVASEIQKAEKE